MAPKPSVPITPADTIRKMSLPDIPPVEADVGRQLQLVVTGQRTLLRGFKTRELLGPVHLECAAHRRPRTTHPMRG